MRRLTRWLGVLAVVALAGLPGRPQGEPFGLRLQGEAPKQPLEEIVRHFAGKEEEYARAHGLYRYQLTIRVQEVDEDGQVAGEFEQVAEVGFDASGRRRATLAENPRTDLSKLGLTRVELDDLEFIPLFILSPAQIPDYDVTYLTRERVDEVDTYLFRVEPNRPVRPGERFFEGIVWVDADKLDIVRVHGRSLPARSGGAFRGYFQRVEVFREPVDEFLFPTYVRAEDVLSARDHPLKLRLIVRFSNHQRVPQPAPAPK